MNQIETVKKIYAAINANDIPRALEFCDPQVVRIEPEGFPTSGIYRGFDEVSAHFSQGRATWAEGSCTPEQLTLEGHKVIVVVHVNVRLKNHSEWIDARIKDVWTFSGDKVVEFQSYLN